MYAKTGYLNSAIKLFYLKDSVEKNIEAHYHEFDKIILFVQGRVKYNIEGRVYDLLPNDIVLVGRNNIHYPIVDATVPYERYILYIDRSFLHNESDDKAALYRCFECSKQRGEYVINMGAGKTLQFIHILKELNMSLNNYEFGDAIYSKTLFLQFIIYLNRALMYMEKHNSCDESLLDRMEVDDNVLAAIRYINRNLSKELTIDIISAELFVSKHYLMRKFKEKTGYSIHKYILHKRLLQAKQLLATGKALLDICFITGFKDYTTFSRSFKNTFKLSPREYRKQLEANAINLTADEACYE